MGRSVGGSIEYLNLRHNKRGIRLRSNSRWETSIASDVETELSATISGTCQLEASNGATHPPTGRFLTKQGLCQSFIPAGPRRRPGTVRPTA